MEADQTLASPAPDAPEAPPSSSEESASPPAQDEAQVSATMNALLRGVIPGGSASNPDADDESDAGGESAPPGDVNPSDAAAAGKLGRRGAAAEISRLAAENARLNAALETLQPKVSDPTDEAQKAAVEREQRYRRLLVKPDNDNDWTSDDWDFLASEKQRRALVPELQQQYEAVLADDLKAHRDAYDGWVSGFKRAFLDDLASAKDVPGVDFEAVQKSKSFAERDRLMYTAGRAQLEPENKTLREENAQLKRELYGVPSGVLNGGRSAAGRTFNENTFMNTLLRGGRG